jgi:predicted nucleotide-binding protein
MAEIELLESLIKNFEELKYGDEANLDAFRRKSEMVIRRLLGTESLYLKDLKVIRFHPNVYPADLSYRMESWNSGRNSTINLLRTVIDEIKLFEKVEPIVSTKISQENSNRIFVIHGHDEAMKIAVARTIERIGLEPIILHEQPNKGLTIIEKFVDYSDVGFAVALLSPDDVAYPNKGKVLNSNTKRARQNVIFELGYFIGRLGRNKVLALYQDGVEIPSDYNGVLYTLYDKPDGNWRYEFVRELKACGYSVDANKLL